MTEDKKNTELNKSLKNGRTSTAGEVTAADICAILEACGKAGVREFHGVGLKVSFGPIPEPSVAYASPSNAGLTPPRGDSEPDPIRERIQEELAMDELAMTDPARYEELMLREVMNGTPGE